jgi:uncharacterized protein
MKRALVVMAALMACRGPSDGKLDKPFLWSAEKDGTTTYLFGTMHMGVDPEKRLPDLVWSRLDAAKAFAMETDPADVTKVDFMRHDGKTLHEELGDVKWHRLQAMIGEQPASRVDPMKPYIAATLVTSSGLPQTMPMDGVLLQHAKNEHKAVVFLEPIETQVTVIEKWLTTRALGEMLDDVPDTTARTKQLLAAYVSGDERAIQRVTDDEHAAAFKHGHTEAEVRDEMTDLLFRRNASWIPLIERMHANGGGFVAVGTLHLVGTGSVVDLLQQRGYKVTRLTP